MELVTLQDDRYETYEKLLIARDNLRKDALSIEYAYLAEFGELLTESFRWKIKCIALKKQIAFCEMAHNRGEEIDLKRMYQEVDEMIASFEKELQDLSEQTQAAKKAEVSTSATVKKVKSTYRRIAKKIHPDINPRTDETEELKNLWQRTLGAYHANDLEEIAEIEILVDAVLKSLGDEIVEIHIENIDKKIKALEEQIHYIMTTQPYKYKTILEDDESRKAEHDRLINEIQEYKVYEDSLNRSLSEILEECGVFNGNGTYN